jgi:predicted outer membrane repeat protein
MKKSKISILLLFLVMILAISAASAADIEDTSDSDVLSVEEAAVDEVVSADAVDEVQTATEDAEVLSADGDGNFTELQTSVNTGMVMMNKDYTRVDGENDISITKDVTILGNNHKIDANNLGGIFRINSGYTLTLIGVTLINGNSEYGGAIYNDGGSATIVNSYFLDNTAEKSGGAIYNNAGSMQITGSTFDGNDLTDRTVNGYGGAAIYDNGGTILLSGATVTNNLKDIVHRGGTGAYTGDLSSAAVTSKGSLTVTDSYFEKNSGSYGGAILSDGANAILRVVGTTFVDNLAFNGGAIDFAGNVYTISNCTFRDNKARGTGSGSTNYAHGGAICAMESNENSLITNCIFEDNSAAIGGAISTTTTQVKDCTFTNNTASASNSENYNGKVNNKGGFGGAVFNDNKITIEDSNFTDSIGRSRGLDLKNADITGSSFTNTIISVNNKGIVSVSNNYYDNEGKDISSNSGCTVDVTIGDGDIPYVTSGTIIFEGDLSFQELQDIINSGTSSITLSGDVIKLASEEETFANGIFVNKSVSLYADGHSITANNGKVFDVTENGNLNLHSANIVGDGTAAIVNNGKVTLYKADPNTFTNVGEYPIDNKGSVYASSLTTFTQLADVIALVNGGEIYIGSSKITKADDEKDAFEDGIIIENDVTIRGYANKGVISSYLDAANSGRIFSVNDGATLTVDTLILKNGNAEKGGAIYVESANALVVKNSELIDNVATYRGGAIYSEGTVIVNNTKLDGNDITFRTKNDDNGGAAIYNLNGVLIIIDSTITNNLKDIVIRNGNAGDLLVGVVVTSGETVITGSYFANNTGSWGGAISSLGYMNTEPYTLTIKDSKFEGNNATFGGAVFVESANLIVENSTFVNNKGVGVGSSGTSDTQGGAIVVFPDGASAEITDSTFIANSANAGGAVSLAGVDTDSIIENCTFTDNAANDGGAVYLWTQDDAVVTVANSTFTGNTAGWGNAISTDGTLALSNNTISGTSADIGNWGGSIISTLYAVVMNNGTYSYHMSDITLNATVTDDNGNLIRDRNIVFIIGDIAKVSATYVDGIYTATYTPTTVGTYVVSVEEEGADGFIVNTSTITISKSLTDLAKLINDDTTGTITLDGDYAYIAEFDEGLENGIVIEKNIIIDANGSTISGSDVARLFYVAEDADLTLKNATLINAKADKGAAVYVENAGLFEAYNVTFFNNTATYRGGAVYSEGSVNIVDSVFDSNDITFRTKNDDNGGAAVYNYNGVLSIVDSNITNNLKDIVIRNGNAGDLLVGVVVTSGETVIRGSYFANNTGSWGGAISSLGYMNTEDYTVTVMDSKFEGNNATFGGAIFVESANLIVENSTFENNKGVGVGSSGTSNTQGGAIIVHPAGSSAKITDSTFIANSANTGGAVSLAGVDQDSIIENCTFTDNTANDGGAVYLWTQGDAAVSVANSTFSGNTAGWGNAISTDGALVLSHNTISSTSADIGNWAGSITSYINATFLANQTVSAGLGDVVVLTATLTDDNGNIIIDNNLLFSVNGETIEDISLDRTTGLYSVEYTITSAGPKVISTNYELDGMEIFTGIVDVPKANVPEFTVVSSDIVEGENATVYVYLYGVDNEGLNATIKFILNDTEYTVDVVNGTGNRTINGLEMGSYPIVGIFDGNDNYNAAYTSDIIYVKGATVLTVDPVEDVEYGETITVTIHLNDTEGVGLTGIVVINGTFNVMVQDGVGTFVIDTQPDRGNYEFEAVYNGDNTFNESSTTFSFNVIKGTPEINVEITTDSINYPGQIVVNITGPDGEYNITVDGQVVPVTVVDGSALKTIEGISVGTQTATVDFAGNDEYKNASVESTFIIVKGTPDISASSASVWIGNDATVIVTVPSDAEGTVTITVNGKKYTAEINEGSATATISADDLVAGENTIDVTFDGDDNYTPNFNSTTLFVLDGVITNATYDYYFTNGVLVDIVPAEATLDFQGLFAGAYTVKINKPVNVISSTGDAVFDSESKSGNAVYSFNVVAGADHTNITGISFMNYCLYIQGASYVTVDDCSLVANVSRVGSGTGFLSIHSNAYYTTVKNCYMENGGTGSSVLVLGKGGKYASFDNNVINITGSSGNVLSSNIFVGTGELPQYVNYTNNVINSKVAASGFMYGITVCGEGNIIENNTLNNFKGNAIINQFGATSTKNVYRGNVITGGGSMQIGTYSIVENNYLEGELTLTEGCIATNNTAPKITISGKNVESFGNTVTGPVTISGANEIFDGNTIVGDVTISGKNVTFTNNNVTGTVTVNSDGNAIMNNEITSTGNYAVDLKTKSNNIVTDNTLIANGKYGDVAVSYNDANNNVVENNLPVAEIEIDAPSVWIGNDNTITVTIVNGTGSVTIKVNDKEYTVDLTDGVASQEFAAEDFIPGVNDVTVTYNGGSFIPAEATDSFRVIDGIITNDTFFDYFTEDGILSDAVPEGAELTFVGEFSNLTTTAVITTPVTIKGEDAVINNMAFSIWADDVTLTNMTFVATTSVGDLIGINANGVTVSNLDITYTVGDESAIAINAVGVEDVIIFNNTIVFESHASQDGKDANAINLDTVTNAIVDANKVTASITGVDADYGRSGLYYRFGMMGVNTVNPIRIVECEAVEFTNNEIDASLNDVKGYYPTVQSVLVVGSTDLVFDSNNFTMIDTFTPVGSPSYLYAFTFGVDDEVTVSNNNFYLETEGGANGLGTAYALQIVSSTMDIIGNNITSVSNGPNLGIYAVMEYNTFDNDFTLTIKDNNLNITGYATGKSTSALVSGMEIGAGESDISGNTIYVYNKAGYQEGSNVYGISYVQSVYTPTLNIVDNEIYVEDGDYAISVQFSRAELTATDNTLVAHERYGDKAVSTKASGAVIEDNTPLAEITIEAANVWIGDDATITVTIPKAVGNVTITVNGKEESVELVDGVATLTVGADDLLMGENTVEVVYDDISYNYAEDETTFQVLDNVVTQDNFFYYFDEGGVLLEDIPYDELIFKGDFDDLGIDIITIPRTIEITGEDAVLNDIALAITADNVEVNDISLIANEVKFTDNKGAVIYVEARDVTLNNVKVDYTVPSDSDPYAIFAKSADGFGLISSEIKFTGKSENTAVQHGLRIVDSNNVLIKGNVIDVLLPARDIFWGGSGIDQDTVLAVGIQNGNNVTFTQNKVTSAILDVVSGSPTLDTIMVYGTTDLEISYNNISQTDLTHTGIVYYFAVDLYSFTGIIEHNNILVNTTAGMPGSGTAYAIQMNGPYTVAVNYNNLTAISKGPSAGIMTANWYGAADLTATFNNIDVTGSGNPGEWMVGLTSGIELQVNVAKVYNNTVYAKSVDAYDDTYHIYGISNDQFAMDVKSIDIRDNEIYSDGKYAVTVNFAADSTVTGNYLMAHELSGDAAVENANTIKDNYPTTIDLTASAENIKVGDVAVINISANKLFTGDVTVIVNGKEETVTLTNGVGSLTVKDLPAGNYTVGVSFDGDKYFNADEATTPLSVSKLDTVITIETTEPVVDEDVTVTVTVPGATGNVTIIVDGNSIEMPLTDGVATVTVAKITAGDHNVVAVYKGDAKYSPANEVYNFNVAKAEDYEFELNITTPEVKVGDSLDINVTLPEDATGMVTVLVDGEEVPYTETDGVISVPGLTAGKHNITVSYSDDKYGEKAISFNVTVDKVESGISAAAENIKVDDDAVINVVLPSDATGKVTVVVLGKEVPATMDSGKGTAVFEGLPEGTYTAKVIFEGDDKYLPGETETQFEVKQVEIDPATAVNVTIPSNTTTPVFSLDLPEDATGYLLVDVNGNRTFAAVENGKASMPLPNLQAGNYTATVTYTGDEKYAGFTTTKDISINATVDENAIDIPAGEPSETPTFSINLPKDASGYFEVNVDGKSYVVPVVNGTASISVPGLSEGNHNVTVKYSGDGKYPAVSKDATVNVHIPVYKITNNKNIKMLYSAKSPYKVLITKDGKAVGAGETVAIKFNGKTYNVKTDKNGYATLKIPNVKPKKATYPITATYKGVTVKNTVKVNNIIKAYNKKVKKSKKVTKVKVSLKKVNKKYLKKKTIKIKFRGKTYKVKTNKKGVATWKVKKSMLKKLKVGKKYKYKVTYGKNTLTKKLTIKR